jgi:cytochrome P450
MLNQKFTITSIYDRSMARNPEKYPDPTRFIPERHMSKMTSEESPARGPDDISFVFGFGRRVWYDTQNSTDN